MWAEVKGPCQGAVLKLSQNLRSNIQILTKFYALSVDCIDTSVAATSKINDCVINTTTMEDGKAPPLLQLHWWLTLPVLTEQRL